MTIGLQGGYFAVQTWLPTYLRLERHFTISHAALDMAVVILGSFTGNVSHGYLSDKIGRRPAFVGYALGAAVTVLVYMIVPFEHMGLLLMAYPLGFFTSGVYGGVGAHPLRALPDTGACQRPGIHLQLRPRIRRAVSIAGRWFERRAGARRRHRGPRIHGLYARSHCGVPDAEEPKRRRTYDDETVASWFDGTMNTMVSKESHR